MSLATAESRQVPASSGFPTAQKGVMATIADTETSSKASAERSSTSSDGSASSVSSSESSVTNSNGEKRKGSLVTDLTYRETPGPKSWTPWQSLIREKAEPQPTKEEMAALLEKFSKIPRLNFVKREHLQGEQGRYRLAPDKYLVCYGRRFGDDKAVYPAEDGLIQYKDFRCKQYYWHEAGVLVDEVLRKKRLRDLKCYVDGGRRKLYTAAIEALDCAPLLEKLLNDLKVFEQENWARGNYGTLLVGYLHWATGEHYLYTTLSVPTQQFEGRSNKDEDAFFGQAPQERMVIPQVIQDAMEYFRFTKRRDSGRSRLKRAPDSQAIIESPSGTDIQKLYLNEAERAIRHIARVQTWHARVNRLKTPTGEIEELLKEIASKEDLSRRSLPPSEEELPALTNTFWVEGRSDNCLLMFTADCEDKLSNMEAVKNHTIVLQDHYISHIVRTLRMDIRYGYANIVFTNEPPAALLSHLCEAIAMEGNQAAKITVWNVGNVDKLKEELEEHGVPEGRVRLHAESFVTAADIRDDLLIDTELVIVNPPSSKELIANVVRVSVRDPTHSTFLETIGNLRQNFKYRGKTYNYFDIQSNTLRAALELPKVKSILYVTHSSAMSENHCLIETVLEELHGSKRAFKRSARAWKTEHAQDLLRKRIPTPEKNLKRSEIDDIDDMDVLSGKQSQLSKSTAENQQSMADTEHGGTPHATGGHGADATGEHVMAATCQQDATGQQKDKEKDTLEGEKAPDTQEVTTAVVVEPETEKGALRTATQPQATRRTSLSGGGRRKTVSFSGVEKQQLTSQNRGARARTVSLSSVPKPKLQQKPLSKPTQKPLQKQAQKTLVTQKPAKGATQQGNQTKPAKKVARPVRTKSISSEQPAAKTVKKKVKKKTTPTLEEKFAYYDDYDNGGEAEGTFEMQTIVDPYRLEEFCQNDGESRMQVMQPTVWADGWALGHLKRVPPPKEKPSAILERYQTMGILNLDEEPAPKPATPPRKAAPLPKVSIEGKAALRRAMAHHARHTTNTGGQKSKGYADMQDVPQAEVQSHHKMSTVHGPMELAGNGSTTVYGREKARNPQPTVSNVQRRRHQRNQAAAPPPPVPPAQPEPVVGSLMRPGVWIPELALGISPKQMRSSFDVLGMSSGSSNSTTLGSDLLHSNVLTHHSPRQTERLHEHTSNRISSRNRPPDHLPLNTDNVQDGADSLIQMDINQARGELPIIAALRLNSSHPPNSPGSPRQQQRMFQHPAAAGKLNSNLLSPGGQQGMLYHEIPPTAQQPSHLPPIGLASNLSSSHSAAAAVASPRDSLEKSLLSPRVKGTPPSTPTFLPPITHSPLARRKGVIQNSPRSATL